MTISIEENQRKSWNQIDSIRRKQLKTKTVKPLKNKVNNKLAVNDESKAEVLFVRSFHNHQVSCDTYAETMAAWIGKQEVEKREPVISHAYHRRG
ncbi:hypothetical protein PoB_004398000 [Plakobranchus ocellatus]|uniref:Uncharacterized protein n=1 Tax=Plakobranchus ocellatus TaxID=259542 RepID=A0AAV4BED4_9GAST|nr:hypothetical protein PoB_004398000 [Plakobranchus ocellatus]